MKTITLLVLLCAQFTVSFSATELLYANRAEDGFISLLVLDFEDLLVNYSDNEVIINNRIDYNFFESEMALKNESGIIQSGSFYIDFRLERDLYSKNFREAFSFCFPVYVQSDQERFLLNLRILNRKTGGSLERNIQINYGNKLEYFSLNNVFPLYMVNDYDFLIGEMSEEVLVEKIYYAMYMDKLPETIKAECSCRTRRVDLKDYLAYLKEHRIFMGKIPVNYLFCSDEVVADPLSYNLKITSVFEQLTTISSVYQKSLLTEFQRKYSPEDQLLQMRLILSQNEYSRLRRANRDELQRKINDYWEDADSNPHSINNPLQELFYQRILHADENFTIPGFIEGWRTDRGRVYIRYGQPDFISVENFPVGQYPHIRWVYYKLNRQFIFYDKKGYGYYELEEKWDF